MRTNNGNDQNPTTSDVRENSGSTDTSHAAGPLSDLTGFQRDAFRVIADSPQSGSDVKHYLESYYRQTVPHGRLYPNLDALIGQGLVKKHQVDGRTNEYTITNRGVREANAHRNWLNKQIPYATVDGSSIKPTPLTDLTGFQRDLLRSVATEVKHGLGIKADLERFYGEVHHGRLYPNLDTLMDKGLLVKEQVDGRTNEYTITDRGVRDLFAHRNWWNQPPEADTSEEGR